jgi:Mlc titration factor MtfA (ptsG expression regulator)
LTATVVFLLALGVIAMLIGRPLWRSYRRRRIRAHPLPESWRADIERAMPLYRRLPAELRARLDGLVQQFVAEKEFVGCQGLTVTREMRLAIAAQACLLVVNRSTRLYDELYSVLVYPAAFIAPETHHDEAGVVHHRESVLTGQTWDTHRVILSWDDVQADAESRGDGFNVVYHEFAHYLDAEDGGVNGAPLLGGTAAYQRWSQVMSSEFERLREAAARGEPTLLDEYGTEDPGEFFAVATEVFLELPAELRAQHPALYTELSRYFRLDPASWLPAP